MPGEVVENRSVVRHFRLGGGAILMVLVVFQHFHTRGCCSKGSRQFHAMGHYFKGAAIFMAFPCEGLMFSRFGVLFI